MTTNSDIRIHAANDLDVLETNKLQRFIVEPIVSNELERKIKRLDNIFY